jgi:hypothetical protein
MKRSILFFLSLVVGSVAQAQDLTVSRVGSEGTDFKYWGTSGGVNAYSMAATSCNVGDIPIDWYANGSNRHPVIGQNMFRIADNQFVQLGQSWLKHGFCAVNETTCGTCQNTPCTTLGIGCADTYSASLNDGQGGGPKSDVDPTGGNHPHPYNGPSSGNATLRGRLQVQATDLAIPGAIYIAEAQYVTKHDQTAGNVRNNASWRRINTTDPTHITAIGTTNIGDPAIYAWAAFDPTVQIVEVVNVDEGGSGVHGYYFLGWKTVDLGNGLWRYEYALQNLSSKRAAGSFAIPIGCEGISVTNATFHDIDYHSGEIWDNTDWEIVEANGWLRFQTTTPYTMNPFGNALRWGTVYNFGFTANMPPVEAGVEIGLFEPGTPDALTPVVQGPCHALPCIIETYCQAAPNSYSGGAEIWAFGSTSVAANNLSLLTTSAVPGEFGIYYYGTQQTEVPFGDGYRCVTGQMWRLNPPIQANIFGDVPLALDFTQQPFHSGSGAIDAGDTFMWQLWYRDPHGPLGNGFNLSNALRITFCP